VAHLTGQLLILGGAALFLFAFWDYRRAARISGRPEVSSATLGIFGLITAGLLVAAVLLFWLTL
jgi:hypothetical protein